MNEQVFENEPDDLTEEEARLLEEEDSLLPDEIAPQTEDGEKPDVPVEIIGVRFRTSGKIYYFDPAGLQFAAGDYAIVETARGTEYGHVTVANRMVSPQEIVLPLRKVIRAATEEDKKRAEKNALREIDAYNVCVEKIAYHKLEMKLVDVEYTFDNSRLLFYFTADGRVDFRELVKDLAAVFRTRIELRQIGIRDEAKLLGGLGICGRPFCCHSFLSDFVQVSIKMAKEQNLSLNSAKISGACGRLMCCLRYESDTYEEEIARTPRVDALVKTVDGDGIVTENSPLSGWIKVRLAKAPEESPKVYHRDDVTVLRPSGGRESFEAMASEASQAAAASKAEKESTRRPRAATLEAQLHKNPQSGVSAEREPKSSGERENKPQKGNPPKKHGAAQKAALDRAGQDAASNSASGAEKENPQKNGYNRRRRRRPSSNSRPEGKKSGEGK